MVRGALPRHADPCPPFAHSTQDLPSALTTLVSFLPLTILGPGTVSVALGATLAPTAASLGQNTNTLPLHAQRGVVQGHQRELHWARRVPSN